MNVQPVSSFLENNTVVRSVGVVQARDNIGYTHRQNLLDLTDDSIANFDMEIGDSYVRKTYWEPALASGYDFMDEADASIYTFDARSDDYRVGDYQVLRTRGGGEAANRALRPLADELDLSEEQQVAFRADTGEFLVYEPK